MASHHTPSHALSKRSDVAVAPPPLTRPVVASERGVAAVFVLVHVLPPGAYCYTRPIAVSFVSDRDGRQLCTPRT